MIRYSHVALLIPLSEPSGREVSEHLGVTPTMVRESTGHQSGPDGLLVPYTSHTWQLDSKKDVSHQPVARIEALLDEVELFSERLLSLDPKFHRWIDMVFHVTPQHPHGVTGEFDWLSLPHQTMGRLSRLQLDLSYESFWFDHPDWHLAWHQKLLRKLGKKAPNQAPEPTSGLRPAVAHL